MVFRKSFPKSNDRYPVWEEVILNEEEEKSIEEKARQGNIVLMKNCITDAKKIVMETDLSKDDITVIAVALFEKNSSHSVYWKERECRKKFDLSNVK